MTPDEAVKHLQKKLQAHNPVDTSGCPKGTAVCIASLAGCQCDDCKAFNALLDERKRALATLQRVREITTSWQYLVLK